MPTLKIELSDYLLKKLRKKKEEDGYGGRSWTDWIRHITKGVIVNPTPSDLISKGTREHLAELWAENFIMNLPEIIDWEGYPENKEEKSIGLLPKFKDRSALVVGAGPSIWKHNHLQVIAESDYGGVLFITDRMLIPCLKAGVTPEKFPDYFVVSVDGNREKILKFFDDPIVDKYADGITALFAATGAPTAVKRFKGRKYFFLGMLDPFHEMDSVTGFMNYMVKLTAVSCLAEGTLIFTNPGIPKPIESIEVGDVVYGIDENMRLVPARVLRVFDNGVKPVYEVRTRRRSIYATEDHLFLVLRKPKTVYWRLTEEGVKIFEERRHELGLTQKELASRVGISEALYIYFKKGRRRLDEKTIRKIAGILGLKNINRYLCDRWVKVKWSNQYFEWVPLSNLREGDIIVTVGELPETRDVPKIPKLTIKGKTIPISEDFMRLLGMFLGDGYARKKGEIAFFITKDSELREKYSTLIERVLGLKTHQKDPRQINIYSAEFVKWLEKVGFKFKALEKEIPEFIFKLPKNLKLAFISGFLDADGSVSKESTVIFESPNKKLIEQLRMLCISIGLRTSNIYTRTKDVSIFNGYRTYHYKNRRLWRFDLSGRNMRELLSPLKEEFIRRLGRKAKLDFSLDALKLGVKIDPKLVLDRVWSIRYIGERHVYDLTVEGIHNYVANGIIVHNCLGNTGSAAIVIAHYLGCKPIILCGMTLGYLPETPLEETAYYQTLKKSGLSEEQILQFFYRGYNPLFDREYVMDAVFKHYRDSLVDAIEQHGIEVVNASEEGSIHGAGIKGMTLKEALRRYKK